MVFLWLESLQIWPLKLGSQGQRGHFPTVQCASLPLCPDPEMPLCLSDMRVDNEVMPLEGGTGELWQWLESPGERESYSHTQRRSREIDRLLGDFCPQRSVNLICQEPLLS